MKHKSIHEFHSGEIYFKLNFSRISIFSTIFMTSFNQIFAGSQLDIFRLTFFHIFYKKKPNFHEIYDRLYASLKYSVRTKTMFVDE